MATKKIKFEAQLKRLQEISTQLEDGDLPLDEMLKAFEEGIKTYRSCNALLEETEAKIQMLISDDQELSS
ncbi:exodeoxyribonuclease VII small subunit [Fusibacter tunisiensis]|uniref:Exodeoxyribonuclease 7 small subunit n=1 Tax=Fusibacter tunisiensis TaxID=1008308 RepID=A0ABS2MQ87_9FIRM|nr:exodeoxyribonuclease VII small subunit [Fusibacter tunisiensis]MBM7561565.1 exodeoxyribonuclease VII small subunit [Fusibacter tunisiensis]